MWTCGWWKLKPYLVLIVCISEFIWNKALLFTTNNRREKIYCDISGRIPNCLNKCLQESLGLESVITLITLVCSQKTDTMSRNAPEDYSIGHQGMKVGIIYIDFRFSWHIKGLTVPKP